MGRGETAQIKNKNRAVKNSMFLTAQFIASPRGSPSARITAGSMPPFAPNVRANSHACGAQTYPTPLGLEGFRSVQDAIKPTRTKSVSWRDSEPPFAPDVRANSYACGAQTYPTPLGLEGSESVQDAIKPTRTKSGFPRSGGILNPRLRRMFVLIPTLAERKLIQPHWGWRG